jgi:hypothetical protein
VSERVCSVEGCEKLVHARGWCSMHYRRWRTHGDPLRTLGAGPRGTCSIDGCEKPVNARGWCGLHYMRWYRDGDPLSASSRIRGTCSIEGCERVHAARGWCDMHWKRWRLFGDPLRLQRDGERCDRGHSRREFGRPWYPPACGHEPARARPDNFVCVLPPDHEGRHRYGPEPVSWRCRACSRVWQGGIPALDSVEHRRRVSRQKRKSSENRRWPRSRNGERLLVDAQVAGKRYRVGSARTEDEACAMYDAWWESTGAALWEQAYGEPWTS